MASRIKLFHIYFKIKQHTLFAELFKQQETVRKRNSVQQRHKNY